jgi:anti-sigma factor RsiW
MECSRFEAGIQGYLDGEMGARESVLVEEHTSRCAPCACLLREYRDLFAALEGLEHEAAPAELETVVLAQLAGFGLAGPGHRRSFRHVLDPSAGSPSAAQMGVAVSVLLGLLYVGTSRLAGLGSRLRDPLGEAATWTYAWANGVTFQRFAHHLVESRGRVESYFGSLTNAARLVVEQRGHVLAATLIAVALTSIALALWHARDTRGGRHVRMHLV